MEAANFQSTFYEACNFVRLHGWCDQTNERITALVAEIRREPELAAERLALVNATVDQVNSLEEKLLIFVLVAELGTPADTVAELMYRHLEGKLTNKDSNFIVRHFFQNRSPVPEEITYDITRRNFISYQRAIYQALKISTFESKFEPRFILLYFIQLLCRNNLNEQNRAMLYLLLSRIDIDLPPAIEQTVRAAMVKLADVIHEVEQRQESVLSDTIQQNGISLEEHDWAQAPRAAKSAQTRPDRDPAAGAALAYGELAAPAGLEAGLRPAPPPRPSAASQPYTGSYFDNYGDRGALDRGDAAAKPAPAKPVAPAPAGLAGAGPGQGPSGNDLSGPPPPADGFAGYGEGLQKGDAKRPDLGGGDAGIPGGAGSAAGDDTFVISFTKESSELKAVLAALKDADQAAAPASGGAVAAAADRLGRRVGLLGKLFQALFRVWWFWLALLLVLGGIGLWLFLAASQPTGGGPTPAVAVDSEGLPVAADAPAAPPPAALGAGAAATDPAGAAQPGAGMDIRRAGGQAAWYPRQGETLWALYRYLRDAPDAAPGLKALTVHEWQGFLAAIAAANPNLSQPDLIYPAKAIMLAAP